MGCLADETLNTKGLENLTEKAGEVLAPHLKGLIDKMQTLPGISGIVNGLGCVVTEVLDGVLIENSAGGLLGGGAGSLLDGPLGGGSAGGPVGGLTGGGGGLLG